MQIEFVDVQNFRALRKAELVLDPATAVIGDNNSGKSAFLKAVELFYDGSARVVETDFSDRNTDEPIKVRIGFGSLTPREEELLKSNMLGDKLVVTRTFHFGNPKASGAFSIDSYVNPDFTVCRDAESKTEARSLYKELMEKYDDLASVKSADEIPERLASWENANKNKLKLQTVAAFRGATNVGLGQLKAHTRFVFVPAVNDTAEAIQNAKTSPVKQLISSLAEQAIENRKEYQEFIQGAREQLKELTDPNNVESLKNISQSLTDILQKYYAKSELLATWNPIEDIPVQFPTPDIKVKDAGFETSIDGVGHGLQRAIILTVLEFIAKREVQASEVSKESFESSQSDIIIAIEEPEIYQHPTKQRLFSDVLRGLAEGFSKSTGIRFQSVFVTHSPLFVSFPNCSDLRIARRKPSQDGIDVTRIDLNECSQRTAKAKGLPADKAWSADKYAAKLHVFSPEIVEGFFAEKVVLVEGAGDRAVLEAFFERRGISPSKEGIAICNVEGKKKLDKPTTIFQHVGIPTYVIFDNDRIEYQSMSPSEQESEADYNRLLQNLCGEIESEDWPCKVHSRHAAFDGNLETYLESVVGTERYNKALTTVAGMHSIKMKDCLKSPVSAGGVIQQFFNGTQDFEHIEKTLDMILALTQP